MYCIPLDGARELDRVGGKAFALARLLRAGFPVPPGFVVTNAARERGLDAELREELSRNFSGRRSIVRSSGVGEDGRDASFAGVLESYPGIETLEGLERALGACWESARSERASSYQASLGVRLAGMGVIVQEQVDAQVSGVLFTDVGGVLLGEYAEGLGTALVEGRVEPGRFSIDRKNGKRLVHEPARNVALDARRIASLTRLGLEVESLFGSPQDVEWAFDRSGRLFVVQSRPITRTTPSRRTVVWSSANVSENFPEPATPFLFSIASLGYEHYFRNLALAFGVPRWRIDEAEPAFRGIIGLQAGRIHYNLTNIHRVLRTVPYGSWLTRSFDDFVGTSGPGAALEERPLRSAFELLVVTMKTGRLYLGLSRRVSEFEATADAFAKRFTPARLNECTLEELRDTLRAFLDIRCHRWLPASLADAAAMVTTGALRALAGAAAGDLLKGLPGLVSAQPALELWDLSRRVRSGDPDVETAFEEYLERWGFRCSGELLMTVPSLQEEPERARELLRSYAALDDERSPYEILAAEAASRKRATARIVRGPLRRTLLSWTHRAIELRERVRLKQALLYNRCRVIALQTGERLAASGAIDEREDVFYLTWEELVDVPEAARDLVAERKRIREEQSRFSPPEQFTLPEGASYGGGSEASDEASSETLTGMAAGSGRARGKAAVLRSSSEGRRLTGQEILIAPQTDPGWGPLFPLIRGLVLERGTLLSHGAILAREFGIPSVVGVRDATKRIADGATVEVDGDRGHVDVLS
jgi:pyruvate,water dikinase